MLNAVTLLTTALVAGAIAAGQVSMSFPGPPDRSVSPGGRYVIDNRDSDDEPNHVLTLKETPTGKILAVLPYPRHVAIVWSASGTALAVNNFEGSDHATCQIIVPGGASAWVDLGQLLMTQYPEDRRLSTRDTHHLYRECIRWLSDGRVRLRVTGYGYSFPDGLETTFDYTVGGRFSTPDERAKIRHER